VKWSRDRLVLAQFLVAVCLRLEKTTKPQWKIKKILTVSSFGFSDGWATTPINCISKRVAPWRMGRDLARQAPAGSSYPSHYQIEETY
jgi:hypothetical protein